MEDETRWQRLTRRPPPPPPPPWSRRMDRWLWAGFFASEVLVGALLLLLIWHRVMPPWVLQIGTAAVLLGVAMAWGLVFRRLYLRADRRTDSEGDASTPLR